jgi:tRNA (cmo5U34)-methyltransferase
MDANQLKTLFDQQAPHYDQQWASLAPIRDGLHFLLESALSGLPPDGRILCVGAGTGAEISHLASRFPGWRFTAVEPSGAMLLHCRERAARDGYLERCDFHEGYVESLPAGARFDAATCFLVSHFFTDRDERIGFFRAIASRLRPGGLLASSDLTADRASPEYEVQLAHWFRMMSGAGIAPDNIERMRAAYAGDVALVPAAELESIVKEAGFVLPVPFHQAGLIRAWLSRRA